MKKLYSTFVVLGICAASFAQDFIYDPSSTVVAELQTQTYSNVDMYIETPSPQDITYRWKLVSNTIPVEWSYSLCDYTTCYPGIPASGTMTPITAADMSNGIRASFKITISPNSTYGNGEVKIWVYDQADSNIGDTVTFQLNHTNSAGLTEEVLASMNLYPNPSEGKFNISNPGSKAVDVEIYSVQGNSIQRLNITPESTETIDMSDLSKGVYFAHLRVGEMIRTQKIVLR